MTERGPDPAQPEGAPPTAVGWYSRMEQQASTTPTSPGSPLPSLGTSASQGGSPPTMPQVAAPPRAGRRRRPPPPGGRTPRKRSGAMAWWALGALLLAAAAVLAIVYGDDLSGTTAADSRKAKDPAAESSAPALPSVSESTETSTDTPTPTTDSTSSTASPSTSDAAADPLGVGVPMTTPACDGTWAVILGSAIDPDAYAEDVTALLGTDPEAKYVLTEGACSSLRQRMPDGSQLYAVYLGPYPDQTSACAVSTELGGGAYVKRMDDTTPSDQIWTC